jgi:transcriptional regulator with PAS, ATPase and Fis domain
MGANLPKPTIKFLRMKYYTFILIGCALLYNFALQPVGLKAQEYPDTSVINTQQQMDNLKEMNAGFMAKAELEHQKMLRNIFMVSFLFVLGILIFTMFFYGSKIKKVSQILFLQNSALQASKDQLVKIINIFNYVDRQVYITDSKGNIEWANNFAMDIFKENYEDQKINLIDKFVEESKKTLAKGILDQLPVFFIDPLFGSTQNNWKMVPIKNSKDEFANMVFIVV